MKRLITSLIITQIFCKLVRKCEEVQFFAMLVEIHYSLGDNEVIYFFLGPRHELHVSLLMDLTKYFCFVQVYIIVLNYLVSAVKIALSA